MEFGMALRMGAAWQRIEFENTPIYIRPEAPDWFVPNPPADDALEKLLKHGKGSHDIQHILKRIDGPAEKDYHSRCDHLAIDALKECWLHITNRCNMACRHCMFQSSLHARDELSVDDCSTVIQQAYELGCRIFYFTGGEPLLSKAFITSVRNILDLADTHVVVLTNLSLVSGAKEHFSAFPRERLHFQVSIDGLQANHDALRGPQAFQQLTKNLMILRELDFPVTLSMTVTRRNVNEMEAIIAFADAEKVGNVHFLWLFQKGNADDTLFVEPEVIFSHLTTAQYQAEKKGVKIDNIEILRSQVFSCPATRYDLSNAGWQSIAVGPDGHIYPTPALIYSSGMICGHVHEGLQHVWHHSRVLNRVRCASLNNSATYRANVLRYIIGGGDIDHSYIHSGRITGGDPYVELYNRIAKWLIVREAAYSNTNGYPALRLRMGEKLGDCPVGEGSIFFTHSNCVLSLPGHDARAQINQVYTKAAETTQEDIRNPISYAERWVQHIPKTMRYRSYGCGSPVLEADIQPGETVLDLGSGTGIECFIASKITGRRGRVIGIDMGDAMLAAAKKTKALVIQNLQYDNVEFKKSFMETLPLADASVDLVVSNCVLNLSPDKRRVFSEILRVLKPGGRLLISDITCGEDIPLAIKYNETLRGECIGGALKYHDLFGLLNDLGFSHSRIVNGYPYRTVKGYDFYSITYQAIKPAEDVMPVLYDFPDFESTMAVVRSVPNCGCFLKPPQKKQALALTEAAKKTGCMVCGADLTYFHVHENRTCHYCGQVIPANAACTKGHFVCDPCHQKDAVAIIKHICLGSQKTDAGSLMQTIRSHPHFKIHGPEHHSLVPAVILTSLRNSGCDITAEQVITGIERGQTIAGGACAFLGVCGAAVGVGIAFSILLAATPYDGDKRQIVQQATQMVLGEIASYNAPRCCQRDCWIALQIASKLLQEQFGKTLPMKPIACGQFLKNRECIHEKCPLWQCRSSPGP
jgi:MoaA/NifB/PqqE/SkfB family radical SAM enzyme/SAM-dependent methyltransferase